MKPFKGNFSGEDLEKLFQAPDDETGDLATPLPLLPGMPVRYTQKMAVKLAISNGADGVLVGVDVLLGTTFSLARFFGVRCKVGSTLPFAAYVRSRWCTAQQPRDFLQ